MSSLGILQGAARRRESFLGRGEGLDVAAEREPTALASKEPLETAALTIVRSALEEKALALGIPKLPAAVLTNMLTAAQAKLRTMSKSELAGFSPASPQFQSITEASFNAIATTDPQRLAELQKISALGGDGTGIDALRLLRGGDDFRARISSCERQREMGSERLSTEERAQVASATAMAMKLGMPWALNNPDLLRLGPEAIRTLHTAGVQRGRFERITGERVGFRASTAVEIAAFAKRRNLTPEQTNRLYDKISDGVEIIAGGNKNIQRELDEATRKYVTGPDTPEARKALEDAWKRQADTPEKRKAAEDVTRALIKPSQQYKADSAQSDADRAATGKKLDDLDAIASSTASDVKSSLPKAADAASKETKTVEVKQDDKKAVPKNLPAQPKLT